MCVGGGGGMIMQDNTHGTLMAQVPQVNKAKGPKPRTLQSAAPPGRLDRRQ